MNIKGQISLQFTDICNQWTCFMISAFKAGFRTSVKCQNPYPYKLFFYRLQFTPSDWKLHRDDALYIRNIMVLWFRSQFLENLLPKSSFGHVDITPAIGTKSKTKHECDCLHWRYVNRVYDVCWSRATKKFVIGHEDTESKISKKLVIDSNRIRTRLRKELVTNRIHRSVDLI